MNHSKIRIPTLMFHGVRSRYISEVPYTEKELFYVIEEEQLSDILGRIADTGWSTTTYAAAVDRAPETARSVCITFDDSYLSHYISALPLLTDFNQNAIFFLTVGDIGRSGRLSWPQVRALADSGMSVQSHTVSHRMLGRLSDEELLRELVESKAILEDATGRAVTMVSLPGGSGGWRAVRLAKRAGYERVFGSQLGYGPTLRREGFCEVEVNRYPVKASAPLDGVMAYLDPTPWSRSQGWVHAMVAMAAKDLLGSTLYEWIKAYPMRRAPQAVLAQQR